MVFCLRRGVMGGKLSVLFHLGPVTILVLGLTSKIHLLFLLIY